ncbi:16S rRNA (uracil(1498)-N(3))-methyltransferase [Candidatus Peregrinibacteria bacterium]|nr:16S rRNA (uracil(1498)-N(3))-methyltransferase [Candidatus Peregrinibacteria bacterium]
MQRFFIDSSDIKGNQIEIRNPQIAHQILRVLRMRTGSCFVALDGSGMEFICKLISANEGAVTADIIEKRANTAEPDLFVTLYQAMPKKMDLFEFVLQKDTEIGVSAFVPLASEFTERGEVSKRDRLERILREAAEQSERGKIPTLHNEIKFPDALNQKLSFPILLHCRGENLPLSSVLNEAKKHGKCELFIGPEGGFSEKEVASAREKNFKICSLGKRILRTETVAISAATILLLQ